LVHRHDADLGRPRLFDPFDPDPRDEIAEAGLSVQFMVLGQRHQLSQPPAILHVADRRDPIRDFDHGPGDPFVLDQPADLPRRRLTLLIIAGDRLRVELQPRGEWRMGDVE
jgi:hypothetical protein